MSNDDAAYEAINAQSELVVQFQQGKLTSKELAVKAELVWKRALSKILQSKG